MGLIDVMLNNYDKNLRKRLAKNRELAKEAKKKNRKASIAYTKALEEIEGLKHGIVYEYCSNCESKVGIAWDCENDGLMAFCPNCGEILMLCSECKGICDWDYGTGICSQMEVLKVGNRKGH